MLKKIALLFLILCFNLTLYSQYIPNYDFYVGTWKYETTNEIFIMKTKKYDYTFMGRHFYILVGTFRYTKNGVTLFDDLNTIQTKTEEALICFSNFVVHSNNQTPNFLKLSFFDPLTGTGNGDSKITIISTSPAKIQWSLKEPEGIVDMDYQGYAIPIEMVLTKVKN
ncbi:MAG: hypothetical protein QMB39_08430 [Bacteroidales bacterium]